MIEEEEIEQSYTKNISKSRPLSAVILYCPNCKIALPSIDIYIDHVKIECFHCHKTVMPSISDYITMMKKENKTQHTCTFNSNHSGRQSYSYCVNCSKWLCQECLNMHTMNDSLSLHLRTAKEVFNNNTKSYRYYCVDCESPIEQKQCEIEEHKIIDYNRIKDDIKEKLKKERNSLINKCDDKPTKELISLIIINYDMFECLNLYEPMNNVMVRLSKGERNYTIPYGKMEEYGVKIDDDGAKYEGYWKNYMRHGKGKLTFLSGELYDGDWVDGKMEGYGVKIDADGSKYEGYWKNNNQHGKGKVSLLSGASFDGSYVDGKREGYGVMIDRNKYKGYWKNGKPHGKGKVSLSSGASYDGDWVDGKREGYGVEIDDNGNKFEGYWKNNKPHGKAKITSLSGASYDGDWVDGKMEGYGVEIDADGNKFEGYWKNNKPHGKVKITCLSGTSYDGSYVDGKREGYGVMIDADGNKYEGYCKNDKQHGKVKATLPDGKSFELNK